MIKITDVRVKQSSLLSKDFLYWKTKEKNILLIKYKY